MQILEEGMVSVRIPFGDHAQFWCLSFQYRSLDGWSYDF